MDFDENKRRRANMYGATKAQKQAYMDSRTGNAGYGKGIMRDKIPQGGAAYGRGINRNLIPQGGAKYGRGINRQLINQSTLNNKQLASNQKVFQGDRGKFAVQDQKGFGQGMAGNSLVDSVLRRNMADDAGESVVYNNNKKYTFDKNYDYPESRYSVNEQGQTEMFDAPWLTTDDTYAGMFGYG